MTRRLVIGLDELTGPPPPDFAICAMRAANDGEDPLYPTPGPEPDTVRTEDGDGADPLRLLCTGIEVHAERRLFSATPVTAVVTLTDTRLTIASSRAHGAGWLGGPLALALNLGGRLRRRRGAMLVGQVRYPWIQAVYAQRKAGLFGVEALRVLVARNGGTLRLDLTLPADLDALAIATTLIRRAGLASHPDLVWPAGAEQMVGVALR